MEYYGSDEEGGGQPRIGQIDRLIADNLAPLLALSRTAEGLVSGILDKQLESYLPFLSEASPNDGVRLRVKLAAWIREMEQAFRLPHMAADPDDTTLYNRVTEMVQYVRSPQQGPSETNEYDDFYQDRPDDVYDSYYHEPRLGMQDVLAECSDRNTVEDFTGTGSLDEGLHRTPDFLATPGLVSMTGGRGSHKGPDRFRAQVKAGKLHTHDGRIPIDTGGKPARFVIIKSGGTIDFYVDQVFSTTHAVTAQDIFTTYPSMDTHEDLSEAGEVLSAGEVVVRDGKITQLTNRSGTWHPRGKHLALALKYLIKTGALGKEDLVTVRQFIPSGGYDVDAGTIHTVNKVWERAFQQKDAVFAPPTSLNESRT